MWRVAVSRLGDLLTLHVSTVEKRSLVSERGGLDDSSNTCVSLYHVFLVASILDTISVWTVIYVSHP
jgi:hypothetical protein